jgi:hypothetical protein
MTFCKFEKHQKIILQFERRLLFNSLCMKFFIKYYQELSHMFREA